jgi:dihydropyrimidinase
MSTQFDLRIAGGTVVLPGAGPRAVDVLVRDGLIAAIADPGEDAAAAEVLDATGLHVLPGAIDAHVHLAQDISYPKETADVAPETASAAAGGVTTLIAYLMTPEPYDDVIGPATAAMDADSAVDYGFHYCITTPEQMARIPAYVAEHGVSSFKFFMNFRGEEGAYLGLPGRDDGFLLDLLEATRDAGAMVNPHAENIELVWRLRGRDLPPGLSDLETWNALRPGYVEADAAARAAYLAQVAGGSVYHVHTTNADAVTLLAQARERYPSVFVETCPHYLTLDTQSDCGVYGKVNPPLRTEADREALWDAIADGIVDTIGSDHVPRHRSAKEKDVMKASAGFPGMETLLPLLLSEGHQRRGIPLERIVDLVSTRPAQLFGLADRKGAIRPGADADFALVDLNAGETIAAADLLASAEYTPWEGYEVGCRVVHTLVRGRFAHRDGAAVAGAGGRFVHRAHSGAAALEGIR